MSDPRRWLDPRSGASDDLRSLLDAAAPPPPLPPGVRAAGAKYVATLSKAAATAAAPAATVAVGAKAAAVLGAVGAAAAIGAAGLRAPGHRAPRHPHAAVAHVARHAPSRPSPAVVAAPVAPAPAEENAPAVVVAPPPTAAPVPVVAPTPAVVMVPAARAEEAPEPAVASLLRATHRHRARSHRRTAPAVTHDPIARPVPAVASPSEESRIEAARARLADAPAQALALAQGADAEGPFAEERAWLTFRALDRLGRAAEARGVGEALVSRWPDSVYAPAVRARLTAPR